MHKYTIQNRDNVYGQPQTVESEKQITKEEVISLYLDMIDDDGEFADAGWYVSAQNEDDALAL